MISDYTENKQYHGNVGQFFFFFFFFFFEIPIFQIGGQRNPTNKKDLPKDVSEIRAVSTFVLLNISLIFMQNISSHFN